MSEELKPCPFCGGKAKLIFRFGIDICCECTECEARTKIFFVRDTAPDVMDEFEENNSKKKKFSIRMDITMDKEMSYETAERTIMIALSQAGMVGHCGGIN